MPVIPLAIDAYKRGDAFQPEVVCLNMLLEEDKSGASPDKVARITRPGLTAYTELPDTVRGMFRQQGLFGGVTFSAAGTKLYSLAAGTYTEEGEIGAGGRVVFAANYEYLFVLSGGIPYLYDGSTVAEIVMPDDREVADIDVLNNFLVLACPDGRFYWLEPGTTVLDSLNFATAESSPDGIVAARAIGDEIIFFGGQRGEVWQLTGDNDAPFLRAGGRNFEVGCLARDAVLRFDNSIVWPGSDGLVYRFGNVPDRISDHGIEQRLRERTSLPDACTAEADGHKLYLLRIPGQGTFSFDAAFPGWRQWSGGETEVWGPYCSAEADVGWLLGASGTGEVWRLDTEAADDDGQAFPQVITATVPLVGLAGRQDSLSIGTGGAEDYTLKVRWRDGLDDWPAYYEELEARAPADVVNLYRLGQPDQPFRTFEVRIDEAVKARISGARLNEAWR